MYPGTYFNKYVFANLSFFFRAVTSARNDAASMAQMIHQVIDSFLLSS